MSNTPIIDIQKIIYFSKEEIAEKTGVSPHTLQNWINSDKPVDTEFETLRGGKRTYSTVYIKRIFTNSNRVDLLPKLHDDESLTSGQSVPDQWSTKGQPLEPTKAFEKQEKPTNDNITELVNQKWEARVDGKEEVIALLKEQLDTTKQQIDLKDGQIADLSRNLNQQQVLQMETVREVTRLREENQKLLLLTVEPMVTPVESQPAPTPPIVETVEINEPKESKKWWQLF